jgi:anti-sigma B factor antagonist
MAQREVDPKLLPPAFAIARTDLDATVCISISGELDGLSAPDLEAEIKDAKNGCNRLVLDLTELTFVDSIGLSVLLTAKRLSREDSFELFVIPSEHDEVTRVLALTETAKALR